MGWFALALILSSLSLVWGLIRLWRQRIARAALEQPPGPVVPTDPMQLAVARMRRPGAEALFMGLPAGLDPACALWSAVIAGEPEVEVCVLRDHPAAAVFSVLRADDAPLPPDLRDTLLGFGQHMEVEQQGALVRLWLYADLQPTAFDLLSGAAAAAHVCRAPRDQGAAQAAIAAQPTPERIEVISWSHAGGLFGALPPFGRAERNANTVRFFSLCRLGLPGGAQGEGAGVDLRGHTLELPRAALRCAPLSDGQVALSADGHEVQVRRLDGRSEVLRAFFETP